MDDAYTVMESDSEPVVYNRCIEQKLDIFDTVHDQQMTISIVFKVAAVFSIIGSSYIIFDILYKKKCIRSPLHRIVLGLSVHDLIVSFFSSFLNTWMVPRESDWWGAIGNCRTCAAQGFFFSFSFEGIMGYICMLSLYCFLKVRKDLEDAKFVKYVESWSHIVNFLFGLIYAIPSLFLNANAPDCDWYSCVPQKFPQPKANLWLTLFPHISELGPDYFYMVFFAGMVFATNFFAWTCLFTVYCDVRKEYKQEIFHNEHDQVYGEEQVDHNREGNKIENNNNDVTAMKSINADDNANGDGLVVPGLDNDINENNEFNALLNEHTRICNDFFFYIMAIHVSIMMPGQIYQLLFAIGDGKISPTGDFIATLYYASFVPLQGFFNMLAYERTRIYNFFKTHFHRNFTSNNKGSSEENDEKEIIQKLISEPNVEVVDLNTSSNE